MRTTALALILMFMLGSVGPSIPSVLEEPQTMNSPATGVDVRVVSATVTYTNAADEGLYKMFSSNHPIVGFNRPAELFVIDAMLNTSATLTITVENVGTAASGVIDVNVRLLHNDYSYFEFANTTVQMAALSGGASNTVDVNVVPSYAGNHTLSMTATSSVSDDNPGNDIRNQPFTVGHTYYNCDSSPQWSLGAGWMYSQEVYTYMTQGSSCHAGNGQFSSYNNNQVAVMTTPVMDMSDALKNPSRTNGLSFFYTGSTAVNDKLTIYGKDLLGAWVEVGSITGTVDAVLTDGANWQTFSVLDKGHASPLIPVQDGLYHSNSQFKFEFTSDASGTDVGFFIDDIVFVYEQKVRPDEYNVTGQGISTNGATPGSWGSVSLEIINSGNISETFIPTLEGLPPTWNAYFARPSGTSFDPLTGLMASPGGSVPFDINIQPDENANVGFQQMAVNISSSQYPEIYTVLPIQFLVKADRIPVIETPSVRPSCPPSFTCTFEVGLSNQGGATDVFDLNMDMANIPSDWSIGLAWTQSSSVLIRPNDTVQALFTMTVPANAAPDTVVEFDLTLQAQNDTSRTDVETIAVSASMVSDADVELSNIDSTGKQYVDAGSQFTLKYTIWNNASRQDIFEMRVDVENLGTWTVHQPTRPDAVLNPGASTTFEVVIDVPENAQANDRGPSITPVIESKRSLMEIQGQAYDGLRVSTTHDVQLFPVSSPSKLTPGIANEIVVRVVNNGNGATEVTLTPEDIPETWTWWLSADGENISQPVELSVSYDLEHEKNISIWVLLPMTEAAGEMHTLQIQAEHVGEGVDLELDDNSIELVMSTDSIRIPSIVAAGQSDGTMAGGSMFAEARLINTGNAVENRLSVEASVSSSPPLPGLIAFFTVEGGDRAVGTEVPLMVPAGDELSLRLDVLIPEGAPLNTRFVLRFDVLGAVDEDNLPKAMSAEALVMLNQQRSVSVEAGVMQVGPVPYGTSGLVQINQTSTSSMNENVVLTMVGEEGWQISCDKRLVNESGVDIAFTPGHVSPQSNQKRCEVLRMSGPLDGQITIESSTKDGSIRTTYILNLSFEAAPADSTMSATTLIGAGLGSLVFIAGLLFLMRGRGGDEELEEVFETTQAGPPVSGVHQQKVVPEVHGEPAKPAGPPVSASPESNEGPPLPEGGLPPGWTQEQWAYYGQQYLDGTL